MLVLRQGIQQERDMLNQARSEIGMLSRELETKKGTGVQDAVKVKELQVVDLREIVDRLETEKEEPNEEICDTRSTIDQLRNAAETVYQDFDGEDLAQLEETIWMKLKESTIY